MKWLKPTTWLVWMCRYLAAQRFSTVLIWAVIGVLVWHGVWRWVEAWLWTESAWPDAFKRPVSLAVYVVPFLWPLGCFLCFIWGLWRRFQSKKIITKLQYRTKSGFDDVSWQDFEVLVAELFRRQGFDVQLQGGDHPDGGIDVIVKRDGGTYLVQCKHWKAQRVGVKVVRELYGVVAAEGKDGGYVITSGHFTPDAVAFAKGIAMKLINGHQLAQIIEEEKNL